MVLDRHHLILALKKLTKLRFKLTKIRNNVIDKLVFCEKVAMVQKYIHKSKTLLLIIHLHYESVVMSSVQVKTSEVSEVTLTVSITESGEGNIQPERPLETGAESLPCAHPSQK